MITDNDIKKCSKIFVTRLEFQQALDRIEENMMTKENGDKLYRLVDSVLGEVKTMRVEQSAHSQRHDDVEDRVTDIEQIPVVAHELKRKKLLKPW